MNKIKDNLLLIFAIIIMVSIFLLGKQCGSSNTFKNDLQPIRDTLIVTKVDTIHSKDTVLKYALKLKFKVDTVIKPIYLDSTECNRIYVYEDSISTKDYTLYRKSHVQGRLRYDTTGVKLKVPLLVINSTTVTIKDSIFVDKPYKYEIHTGVVASPKFLAPTIDLSINKITYSVGYDPFNKQPIIGLKYRLIGWNPKKKK